MLHVHDRYSNLKTLTDSKNRITYVYSSGVCKFKDAESLGPIVLLDMHFSFGGTFIDI